MLSILVIAMRFIITTYHQVSIHNSDTVIWDGIILLLVALLYILFGGFTTDNADINSVYVIIFTNTAVVSEYSII